MKSLACLGSVVGLLFSTSVLAQEAKEPPLITVTGTAEVKVIPDIAQLSFRVETRNRDLSLARSQNNTQVSSVLTVIKKFGIESKDVQTTALQISPDYDDEKSGRRIRYFSVNTGFTVVLRKIEQAADLVSELVSAGANQISSVTFGSSESRKYADRARSLAFTGSQREGARRGQRTGCSARQAVPGSRSRC